VKFDRHGFPVSVASFAKALTEISNIVRGLVARPGGEETDYWNARLLSNAGTRPNDRTTK
jgi:hypothetical protein